MFAKKEKGCSVRFNPTATLASSLMFPGIAIKEDGKIHVAYYLLAVTIIMRFIDLVGIWFLPNVILYGVVRILPVLLSLVTILVWLGPQLTKWRGNPDKPVLIGLGFLTATALMLLIFWLLGNLDILNAFIAIGIIAVVWPRVSSFENKTLIWITFSFFLFVSLLSLRSTYFMELVIMKSDTMNETLPEGEMGLVQKYGYGAVERGDVVAIDSTKIPRYSPLLLSRVVAIEGDIVQIKYAHLYVNSEVVQDDVLGVGCYGVGYDLTIPKDSFFILGDTESFDSRFFGPIPKSSIVGKLLQP